MKKTSVLLYILIFSIVITPCSGAQEGEPNFGSNKITVSEDLMPVMGNEAPTAVPTPGDVQSEAMQNVNPVENAKVKSAEVTPTPSKNEAMFQNEAQMAEQKGKTQEQIEREVSDLFAEGKKYYVIEDYEGAVEIWDRILQNYPTSKQLYDVRYALATASEFAKKYDKAILNYQKVLAEKPKSDIATEARYRLAECYRRMEKWNYALDTYKDIISRSPDSFDSVRAYFNMANLYYVKLDFKKAENIFLNIIKYYPNTESERQARFQLASLFAQTRRYKSAIKEFRQIENKYADTEWAPMAAMHVGDTYKLAGDLKNAKNAYDKVVFNYFNYPGYVVQAEERINAMKNLKSNPQYQSEHNEQ